MSSIAYTEANKAPHHQDASISNVVRMRLREPDESYASRNLASHFGGFPASSNAHVATKPLHGERDMPGPTTGEIDAKIEASEARGETRISRLEGKIDTYAATVSGQINTLRADISGQFDTLKRQVSDTDKYNRDTRLVMIGLFITVFFGLAALIVAVATYGDALFGRGMNVRDVVQSILKETQDEQRAAHVPVTPPSSSTPAPAQSQSNNPK